MPRFILLPGQALTLADRSQPSVILDLDPQCPSEQSRADVRVHRDGYLHDFLRIEEFLERGEGRVVDVAAGGLVDVGQERALPVVEQSARTPVADGLDLLRRVAAGAHHRTVLVHFVIALPKLRRAQDGKLDQRTRRLGVEADGVGHGRSGPGEFRRVAPDKNEVNDLTATVARVVEHRLQIWIGGILLHRWHAGDRPFSTCGDCERYHDRHKSGNWQRPLSWFIASFLSALRKSASEDILRCQRDSYAGRPPPAAIHSSTSFSSTARGSEPLSITTAWKSRTSNFGPRAFSARARSSRNLRWPSMYPRACEGLEK